MKTKQELIDILHQDLVMKSKTISHIVLEGTDGVGKTSLLRNLLAAYQYRYVVYDRGELSNFVYAKKYYRPFISLQRNLPFLYVLLTADESALRERILMRGIKEHQTMQTIDYELSKIKDQKLFIEAAKDFENDYHIITVDTTGLNEQQVCTKVVNMVDEYVDALPCDKEETEWNKMYRKACDKSGKTFEVRANQPYIDGKMFMSESTWQNGAYETFTNKLCPDNLLFASAYSENCYCLGTDNKDLDFAYVINSKINRRFEVLDYYLEMLKHNKTCLVSDKIQKAFDDDRFKAIPKTFGDDFIRQLSRANATVYCARDLEYLKLQTARLYEGIMANQIVFVDQESDKDCDMLKMIHRDDKIIDLLYTTPEYFVSSYDKIMNNNSLRERILFNQRSWYEVLKRKVL